MTTTKTQKPAAAKAAPAKAPKAAIKGDIPGLWIEAVSDQGRWRAGHHWPRSGQGIALEGLSETKVAALKADPMLRVKEVVFSDEDKPGVIGYIDPDAVDLESGEFEVVDDPAAASSDAGSASE